MVVSYLGNGCIRLQSGETSLLVNPENARLKADVVLRTITAVNVLPPAGEIVFPGEYESGGIEVRGIPLDAESTEKYVKTVYAVSWEEMRFVFLGHLSRSASVTDELAEELGEPDLLFVPTGGEHFLSAPDAAKLAKRLEPSVVIPVYYKSPNEFLGAAGVKGETMEKLVFKKKDLAGVKTRVVILETKG